MTALRIKDAARQSRRLYTVWAPWEFRLVDAALLSEQADVIATTRSDWATVEPSEGNFDWADFDQTISLAQGEGMTLRGQPIVQTNPAVLPGWLESKLSGTPSSWQATLEAHIDEFHSHLGDFPPFVYWEVVNEVINLDDQTTTTHGAWHDAAVANSEAGSAPVDHCFNYINNLWPHIPLIINDKFWHFRSAQGNNGRVNAIDYLTAALADSVPISGVGMQLHVQSAGASIALDSLKATCAEIAGLGLPVYITELDCRAEPGTAWSQTEVDIAAARTIRTLVAAVRDNCDLVAIGTWGLLDEHANWVTDAEVQRPLFFETGTRQPKRSAYALARVLAESPRNSAELNL